MNIKDFFVKCLDKNIILNLFYAILGIFVLTLNQNAMIDFAFIICIALLLFSGIVLFAYCFSSNVLSNGKFRFGVLICLLIGIILLVVKDSFFILLNATSLLIIILALLRNFKTEIKNKIFVIQLIKNILCLIFIVTSLVLFILDIKLLTKIFIGSEIIFYSICEILESLMYKKMKN